MTVLYKLAAEQLSKQHHYDFGLRALKSVLVMAGALKRGSPGTPEQLVLMRALRDMNLPKFVYDDVPLFLGLVSVNCELSNTPACIHCPLSRQRRRAFCLPLPAWRFQHVIASPAPASEYPAPPCARSPQVNDLFPGLDCPRVRYPRLNDEIEAELAAGGYQVRASLTTLLKLSAAAVAREQEAGAWMSALLSSE